jgi:mono/diheme cytochrome c family protein
MRKRALGLTVVVFVGAALAPLDTRAQTAPSTPAQPSPTPHALRSPAAFASIQDAASRSAALFVEAGKVLQHPRCVNCHPASDRPSQGAGYPHQPPVQRGADGLGVTAMRCATCHQTTNFDPGRVPGNPKWRLAPASMAWQGRSLADICAQVKDPARNGGHSLAEIVEHAARDPLVGWAWNPGADREPAPGTQAVFGALVNAWVASGAVCPAR